MGRGRETTAVVGRQLQESKQAVMVAWTKRRWRGVDRFRTSLFATPWTIESMEFSRPEYWSG